jgi:hypothetical protein
MAAIGFVLFMVGAIAAALSPKEYPGNWVAVPILTSLGIGALLLLISIAQILWKALP